MKRLALTVTLILALVMAATVVWSQDDEIILKHDEFGDRSRPPVTFNHLTHSDLINCSVCHHSYMLIDNADASEGTPCTTCHQLAATPEVPVPLLTAFHGNCKGCHENYLRWGRKTGPVMCGECHRKAAE